MREAIKQQDNYTTFFNPVTGNCRILASTKEHSTGTVMSESKNNGSYREAQKQQEPRIGWYTDSYSITKKSMSCDFC